MSTCPPLSHPGRIPANKYMLKVNNENARKKCELRSESTIKTSDRRQLCLSGNLVVNFGHVPYFFVVLALLNLNRSMFSGTVQINIIQKS